VTSVICWERRGRESVDDGVVFVVVTGVECVVDVVEDEGMKPTASIG
jgi:hypothetical protein